MMRTYSIIVLSVFIITSVSFPARGAKRISVAVAAAHGSGAKSEQLSELLNDRLSRSTTYHFIERGIVRQVVDYHNRSVTSPQLAPARSYLARAQEHYFHMQYEDAAAEVRRSVRLLQEDASSLHDKGQLLFDALMTQTMVARTMKDDALMRSALGQATKLNPMRALDRTMYPPSVVNLFDAERTALTGRGVGGIRVKTNPPVADVYLNGIACGATPLQLSGLPAGTYDLMIRTNKYAPVKRKVAVAAGQTKNVAQRLAWKGNGARRKAGRVPQTGRQEIDAALSVADLLKSDRAILVSADERKDGSGVVRARLVDRRYRAAYVPIVARYDASDREAVLDELSQALAERIGQDLASDPGGLADPQGTADPMLLGKNKRKIHRQPLFWGAVGTVVAGAIAGGVVAALSGGGSSEDTGSVRVNFR